MDAVVLMVVAFVGYLVAYHTYGRFVAKKIFGLRREAAVPSKTLEDGIDYVPTRKGIIFGHHYTSIAGTGPIVGPAIGIIWGWLPAMLWVFLGSIFMGAVHDLGALIISMRNEGKSIAEITARYIGPRVRWIFFLVVFFTLLIVVAIFGLVIAVVFKTVAGSVVPVWLQIPIAVGLGYVVYKKSGNVVLSTAVAVLLMYLTMYVGHLLPVKLPDVFLGYGSGAAPSALLGIPDTGVWTIILLVYAFVASTLPVTVLLQPRDYINAWQLFIAMGLLVLGVIASGLWGNLEIVAPAYNHNASAAGAPSLWPFLFVFIACGAVSGFHSLVSSGTTSKQVQSEADAQAVGYGSMLLESVLAMLIILAVGAGIGMGYKTSGGEVVTGITAWNAHYGNWTAATTGLGPKLKAAITGSANLISSIGVPKNIGMVIIGVFIASFAGTTLDTATRIQRYVVAEIFTDLKLKFMANRYVATVFAVLTAGWLAFATGAGGKGAMELWPMFGAVNQLLAALALLLITNYLRTKGGLKYLVSGIPCVFMLVMTLWAMVANEMNYYRAYRASGSWVLMVVNGATLLLAVWMTVESIVALCRPGDGAASSAPALSDAE